MLYLDTSILVSMFSGESRAEALRLWHAGLAASSILMSEWTIAEFYSAMSFKVRTRQLDAKQRGQVELLFEAYLVEFPNRLPIEAACFRRAAAIAGRSDLNIRASDALHLAVAEAGSATCVTLDKKMLRAAMKLGNAALMP